MRAESEPVENLPGPKADPDEPPPVLGTWGRLYVAVIVNTLVVYLLLFLFSHSFRP
jgi:hypothetical protein